MDVTVLRLGHRPERDKRITTHVALTARALGARRVVVAEADDRVAGTVRDVATRFGGTMTIETGVGWKPVLTGFDGTKVHLTMYGLPMQEVVPRVTLDRPLLVVVGAEKVPREVYDLVDWNVAVGNQPHSEVAALALFLYALQGNAALEHAFPGAELEVDPTARGKRMRTPDAASD